MKNPPDESAAPGSGRNVSGFGPGVVFSLSVIGAGDYVSNTAIGAAYGTAMLWTLVVALFCRYVWIEACARYVLVTGQTPFGGFAGISRALVWVVLITLIVHRHVHGLGHVLYMGLSIHLLVPLPFAASAQVWSVVFVLAGFGMTMWSSPRMLEQIFRLLMAMMGLALIVVVVLSPPPLGELLRGLFVPSLPQATGPYSGLLLFTALLGTETCSLSNMTYSYFMLQKGWRDLSSMGEQRRDLLYGVAAMLFAGAFLQIASAGTLGKSGVPLRNIEDLVSVFSERLGIVGRVSFGLGIWAAVFTSFVGGIRGYALAAADVLRILGIAKTAGPATAEEARRDPLMRTLIVFFCFSPLYILYTTVRPVWLMLMASSASVIVVPVITFALLKLTADRRVMGEHRNGWLTNGVLVFVGSVACYFLYQNALELLGW